MEAEALTIAGIPASSTYELLNNICCLEGSGTSVRDDRALHDCSGGQMIQVFENAL